MISYFVFLILLLTGQGSAQSQCYTGSGCTGDILQADDATYCCFSGIGTQYGQSYGVDSEDCEIPNCLGECL